MEELNKRLDNIQQETLLTDYQIDSAQKFWRENLSICLNEYSQVHMSKDNLIIICRTDYFPISEFRLAVLTVSSTC